MKKMIKNHMFCIAASLREISDKYRAKKTFLDVGCGDGSRTAIFNAHGRTVWGIDRMVWLADGVRKHIRFVQADFMEGRLAFEDGSFDLIFSFDVIEHLKEPSVMLDEMRRLLKKDGVLIISTPNRNRICGFILQAAGLRKFPFYPDEGTREFDPYAWHYREYTAGELRRFLRAEGFETVVTRKIFYGLPGRAGLATCFSLPLYHNIILECRKR
jgi:2-polyprenyl-3-methyl-5-hydroxy-6-metoxy-1,4-benzoquinol methylase